MKKIFHLVTIIFLIISCSKENPTPDIPTTIWAKGEQDFGWVKAEKNGLEYNASAFILNTQQEGFVGVLFHTYSEEGFLREEIAFDKIPLSVKTFQVLRDIDYKDDEFIEGFFFGIISHGDVLDSEYKIDESKENTFAITHIDTVENVVRGSFDVWFIEDDPYISIVDPSSLHFSEGEFEVGFE